MARKRYKPEEIVACTHLGLHLTDERIKGRKIGAVRGARQQPDKARRRRFAIPAGSDYQRTSGAYSRFAPRSACRRRDGKSLAQT